MASLWAIGLAACRNDVRAIPPPPYVPPYSAEEALVRFLGSECGQALGAARVGRVGLRGFQEHTGPEVILDLEIFLPASSSGVELRISATAGLDPVTGEVEETRACAARLRKQIDHAIHTLAVAEADPDVKRYLADHPPASAIQAHMAPDGSIVWISEGSEPLVWRRK